jgi:hypothetical protein
MGVPIRGRLLHDLIDFSPHNTMRRWRGMERRDDPLFSAKAGSTRSPNQVSWFRNRNPSANSNSLICVRLMATPLTSWRYAASRSSVQQAIDNPRSVGSVRLIAMTSFTYASVHIAGRPGRGAFCNPANPRRLKRFSQDRTVVRAGSVRECARRWIVSASSSLGFRIRRTMGHLL